MTIKELENKILDARKSYYSLEETDIEPISDAEYDKLESELRKLDPNNKLLKGIGVEENLTTFKKVKHDLPMRSIEKIRGIEDFQAWYEEKCSNLGKNDKRVIVTPKIDGVSGEILYINGKLTEISTRGDGLTGYEIPNYMKSPNIQKEIPYSKEVRIRGEFYIPKKLKDSLGENIPLRNQCSGLLKRLIWSKEMENVYFVAYTYVIDGILYSSDDFLTDIYANTVKYYTFSDAIESVNDFYNNYLKKLRDGYIYETDGIVVEFLDKETRKILNKTKKLDHHNHFCCAIKPPSKSSKGILERIEISVSRTGRIIPVGVLKQPVEIDSVKISRFTLNNIDFVKRNDICLGDEVIIDRRFDVIPQLVSNTHTKYSRKYDTRMLRCPSCNTLLVEDGVDLVCKKHNCLQKRVKQFDHWFRNNEIYNFGESTIEKMILLTNINEIYQLYSLSEEGIDKLLVEVNLDPMCSKALQFKKSLNLSRKQTFSSVLSNIGIPKLGKSNAKKFNINSIDDLNNFMELKEFDKSIREVSISFQNWLKDKLNYDSLINLIRILEKDIIEEETNQYNNKGIVVLTGIFDKPKKDIEKEYLEMGFKVNTTVTKETTILIQGFSDKTLIEHITGSKVKKALELGIPVKKYEIK